MKKIIATATGLLMLMGVGVISTAQAFPKNDQTNTYTCAEKLKVMGKKWSTVYDASGKKRVQLDTISCRADTGYENDHDYAGKNTMKGSR